MINRSVVRIPLVPTVFKEYFDMFFKEVRKKYKSKNIVAISGMNLATNHKHSVYIFTASYLILIHL